METFEGQLEQHIVFSNGALHRLGEFTRALEGQRVLLVTDRGVAGAGILAKAVAALDDEGVDVHVFADVTPNPTTADVDAAVALAKKNAPIDMIIGLGGGSAMDCAKGANFLLTNGGKMADYWGTNKATQPMLPSIGIPTTIGTGSEAQSYCLISQADTRVKMACGDKKALFRTVILDPTLTETLPMRVASVTGLDAVSHAVESYVSTRRNPISQMFARTAWDMLHNNFANAVHYKGQRSQMLLGAYLAGVAIENAMLGAAHACANPLTERYGVPHGEAVSLMLPPVVEFNKSVVGDMYDELYDPGYLSVRIRALRQLGGLLDTLQDYGVRTSDIPELATAAAGQWTAQFNPRPLEISDFVRLYEEAY